MNINKITENYKNKIYLYLYIIFMLLIFIFYKKVF